MKQNIEQDARFASIGNLPSNFIPYKNEFEELNIRQFIVGELKLLSRATITKNVASTIKAVDQTIDVDVKRLTIGDFYYVLMWHKLHSFPKTPLTVTWECNHKVPVIRNAGAEPKYESCNQANAQLIHQSDIKIVSLEDNFVALPDGFSFPRVSLLPELFDLKSDPDFQLLLGAVQWLEYGETLAEKFEYLDSLTDITLFQEAEQINKNVIHGVNEYVKLKCAKCDSTFTKKLDLDPLNFFRSDF